MKTKRADPRLFLFTAILCVLAITWLAKSWLVEEKSEAGDSRPLAAKPATYRRIVSMAPSITEILFALGAGDRVVAVTRFCDYPPEARNRTVLGDYLDVNFEALLAVEPDLIVLTTFIEHGALHSKMKSAGLSTVVIDHQTIPAVIDSIRVLGQYTDSTKEAATIVSNMETRMEVLRQTIGDRKRPAVLVTLERRIGSKTFREVYVAGKNTFYDEIIELAGGRNACPTEDLRYPRLSPENLLDLDPDVILDLVPKNQQKGLSLAQIHDDWLVLKNLKAVQNQRVHVIEEGYAFIPGPRIVLFLEQVAKLLHPAIQKSEVRDQRSETGGH